MRSVWVRNFSSAVQALLGRLPTAGTCAALHVAARVHAGIIFSLHMFGELLCVFYTVGWAILYCATPSVGEDAARFLTVGCATLYCAPAPYTAVGADAARFIYGWLRDPSLCYPPTLLFGRMLPVFNTVGRAILYCDTLPYTTVGADAARFLYGLLRDPRLCYPTLRYC